MADVSHSSADFRIVEGDPKIVDLGGTVSGAQIISADENWLYRRADANLADRIDRLAISAGFGGVSGQKGLALKSGIVTLTAALTPGKVYYLSSNEGQICPEADVIAGMYVVIVGYALSTSQMKLILENTGVLKA